MPMTPEEAVASAQSNVAGLLHHEPWIPGFLGVVADQTPWRVKLESAPPTESPEYFIVTFRRGKRATARMAIHADTGRIREIRAIQSAGTELIEYVDPLAAPLPLPATGAPWIAEPDLHWRPCRQSTSMLDPFFVCKAGALRVFVRVDGQVFNDLIVASHG